jgi:hypothetical protein
MTGYKDSTDKRRIHPTYEGIGSVKSPEGGFWDDAVVLVDSDTGIFYKPVNWLAYINPAKNNEIWRFKEVIPEDPEKIEWRTRYDYDDKGKYVGKKSLDQRREE